MTSNTEQQSKISLNMVQAVVNAKPDDTIEHRYNLTNGSEVFETRKMTEAEWKKANAMTQFMTRGKILPWRWERDKNEI